jgi:hypothetical protein
LDNFFSFVASCGIFWVESFDISISITHDDVLYRLLFPGFLF